MRIAITLLAVVVGLLFAWGFFVTSGPQHAASPIGQTEQTIDQTSGPETDRSADVVPQTGDGRTTPPLDTADETFPAKDIDLPPIEGLKAVADDQARVSTIGSLDPEDGYAFEAEATGWGGGIRYIRLSRIQHNQ